MANPVASAVIRVLRVSDTSDAVASARWCDDTGAPYVITAAEMQIRVPGAADPPLISLTDGAGITLQPDGWVDVLVQAATVAAAAFEAAVDPWWELVVTRLDGVTYSLMGGPVEWSKGVVA